MNRLYGWRGNPLYQSGTLVILSFLLMLATGTYLLFFYRVGDPYASMERIEGQIALGRWIRALHRYSADLAVVAMGIHALRMFVQAKSFGPRTRAWISGLFLVFLIFVCGFTGYVMLWDEQALILAAEGARLLDILPIFSEPLARTFTGERPMPGAFFFLNLFAHVALPIGLALLLWVHVSRLARPVLLPPRGLMAWTAGGLVLLSLAWPAPLGPRADPFVLPASVPLDVFYLFWLPWTQGASPSTVWIGLAVVSALALSVPVWTRPASAEIPEPSSVDPHLCTGCHQCPEDCPYSAIEMVRVTERPHEVARVDPNLCVRCGLCTGSCAPMSVGVPGWTGRDEVAEIRAEIQERGLASADVVIIACEHGAGGLGEVESFEGARVHRARCAGNVHTSVIEMLLRAGARGVLVATCPPRDCIGREGPRWLLARLYEGREAELRESLDRRRIDVVHAGLAESRRVADALRALRSTIQDLDASEAEREIELDTECERAEAEAGR